MHSVNKYIRLMKHRITTLLLVLPLLFASCSKDYFSELRHPIEIQGSFDPVYGFPLAKMSADMGTIVGMFDTNQRIVVYVGSDDVVTFQYDYYQHAVLSWSTEDAKGTRKATKAPEDTLYSYNVIQGTQNFDIFERLKYFDTNSFNVNHFFVTVNADVQGFVNSSFQAVIAEGSNLMFDSLILVVNCIDGYREELPLLIASERVSVTELLESRFIPILEKYDFRTIVEHKPVSIDYTVRLCIMLPASQMMPGSTFNEQINQIGVDSIVADFNAQLELPLMFYSNNIPYIDTLPLDLSDLEERLNSIENDTLRGEHYTVHLNDSNCYIAFVVKNSLPVGLSYNVTFIDENDSPILSTLYEGDYEMYAAPVKPFTGHENTYISNGYTTSQFKLNLSLDNLKKLSRTQRIIYSINLNTSHPGLPGDKPYVAVRKDDRLDIRSFVVVSPHADFTLPLDFSNIPFLNR